MTINRYLNIWYGSSVNLYQCEMCSLVINVSYNLWNEWRRVCPRTNWCRLNNKWNSEGKAAQGVVLWLDIWRKAMSKICAYNELTFFQPLDGFTAMFVHWHLTPSFYCQCPASVPAPSPPSECHLLPGTSLTSSIPDRLEQCAEQYQSIPTIFHANVTKYDVAALSCHPLQHSSCWEALRNSPKLLLYDKALACGDFFLDKTATLSGKNWYWKLGTRDQDAIPTS